MGRTGGGRVSTVDQVIRRQNGVRLPKNQAPAGSPPGHELLRFGDCAVIDYTVRMLADTERLSYQTVRGVFAGYSK